MIPLTGMRLRQDSGRRQLPAGLTPKKEHDEKKHSHIIAVTGILPG
jgi:hypothetical protein